MRETIDSEISEITEKVLSMLKSSSLEKLIDLNHILLLFKLYKFTPGVTKVCDMLNLKTELVNYYIEQNNINELVAYCKLNGP